MRLLLIFALLFASIEDSHARRRRKSSSSSSRSSGKSGGWETAAGILYSNFGANVNNFKYTTGGTSESSVIDFQYKYETGIGFSLETRSIENHSWGTVIGLEYHQAKKLEELKINSFPPDPSENGTTSKCSSDCSEIQTTNLILNTFYQWEQFYIPFGLIYSISRFENEGFSGKIDSSLGLNIGIGFKVDDRFMFEVNSRAFSFKLEQTENVSSDKYEFEGVASIASLALKALF